MNVWNKTFFSPRKILANQIALLRKEWQKRHILLFSLGAGRKKVPWPDDDPLQDGTFPGRVFSMHAFFPPHRDAVAHGHSNLALGVRRRPPPGFPFRLIVHDPISRVYTQNISSFQIICSELRFQLNRLHARWIYLIRLSRVCARQAFNQNKTFWHARNDLAQLHDARFSHISK